MAQSVGIGLRRGGPATACWFGGRVACVPGFGGSAMAFAIGEFVGGFIAAIFIPLFLFYLANSKGRSIRAAIILRCAAVLVALLTTVAEAIGTGGQYPIAGLLATAVCLLWAAFSTVRSSAGRALNGWQRLALICMIAWGVWALAYGPLWLRGRQINQAQSNFASCVRAFANMPGDFCSGTYKADYQAAIDGNPWWFAPIMAFVPILLAWGLAWIVVRLFRWVRAGFVRRDA